MGKRWVLAFALLLVYPIYAADSVCNQPGTVFCSGFEESSWRSVWDDYDGNPEETNQLTTNPGPESISGNHVMRLFAPDTGNEPSGADLVKVLPSSYDKMYARWYEYWEPGYDFNAKNHGGGLYAGPRDLLGRSDIRPNADEFYTSWLEPEADDPTLNGRPYLYTYYRGMYQDCANPNGECWGDHLPCMVDEGYYCEKAEHRETVMPPPFQTGRWYCIEIMLEAGTPVQSDALADGRQDFWIDGIEYGPFQHLWHRSTPNLKINILWLNRYHHGTHALVGVLFDNVVVSQNRIGCLSSAQDCSAVNIRCVGSSQEYVTIQGAVDAAVPGDTVLIYPGTYALTQNIHVTRSGTVNQPITIKGESTGAIIDASQFTGGTNDRDAIFVDNADYVTIENLEIKNSARSGMRISQSDHVTVRGVHSHHNGVWGIFTDFSNYLLLENNECDNSGEQHGIYVSNSGDNPTVRGNRLHDNADCGLHMNGDLSMGGDGTISNALVENNIIYNNGLTGGSSLNGDGVINSVIRNNLIYEAHASGISLYQTDGAVPSTGNQVYHNTVVMASDGRWALNIKGGSSATAYNNILMTKHPSRGSISLDTQSSVVSDYNILTANQNVVTPDDDTTYRTFAQWQATGHDTHSLQASIASVLGSDYKLIANSPAINKATSTLTTSADLAGASRVSAPDIGAYEYTSQSSCTPIAEVCGNGIDEDCTGSDLTCTCGAADANKDNAISTSELASYISQWLAGTVQIKPLMEAIRMWKGGC
jgi:parallel beta-helix repeat protein